MVFYLYVKSKDQLGSRFNHILISIQTLDLGDTKYLVIVLIVLQIRT